MDALLQHVQAFGWPTLDAAYWLRSSTQIWLLWIAGVALIVASWQRSMTRRAGWLGLAAALVGVLAASFTAEATRHAVIIVGVAIVATLLAVAAWRGELLRSRIEPGDYEAELAALCGGNRRRAERLIRDEMQQRPGVSRAGAALAVVTRLRHERDPSSRRL